MPRTASLILWAAGLFACKGAARPHVPSASDGTIEIGRDGASLRGVAGDGTLTFAALASAEASTVEARRGSEVAWRTPLAGTAGELAIAGDLVAVGVAGSGTLDGLALRGSPSAVVAGLDRANGKQRWRTAFDSSEWTIVSSIAAIGADVLVGGTFAGSLRAGSHVVTSAGGSDGFVSRLTATGQVVWIVRTGGWGADGIQGVAAHGDRIAIAGTFTAGADLLGAPLAAFDDRSPFGDAFVAELDGKGTRRWQATFGGRTDDAAAGVTFDASGRVVVAASARDTVDVGSAHLVTQGTGDGVVVWMGEGGEKGAAVLVGGLDFDGLRAITAVGDTIIVGGFFSGEIKLGARTLTAGGGDDAFIAALDPNGTVTTSWHVGGSGREEITGLSAIPGGFIAGAAHTAAANIEGVELAAPKDPMSGATLVVRGL